jgi:hypothetical protein
VDDLGDLMAGAATEAVRFTGICSYGSGLFLARIDHASPDVLTISLPSSKLLKGSEQKWLRRQDNSFRVHRTSNEPMFTQSDDKPDDVVPTPTFNQKLPTL